MVIKENIKKTYNNVNAELFLRFILHDANIDSLKTNKDVLEYIVSMKKQKEIFQKPERLPGRNSWS